MITRSYKALTSRPVFVLAAALAILMLAAPFVFAATSVDYTENSTDPVATFSAMDQDGDAIVWSLAEKDDYKRFMIDAGVLSFKSPPNYEKPNSGVSGGTLADRNVYKVTVQATGGSEDVVVTVTNVDEDGSVSFTGEGEFQPQVGRGLEASLSDEDDSVSDAKWQWARSADMEAWTDIMGATSQTRSPVAADEGMYLRASVTYTDSFGSGKMAFAVTANLVEERTVANAAPSFKDQDDDNGDTPMDGIQVSRKVEENAAGASSIGKPVSASDSDNDVLVYTLSGTDADRFDIGKSTGQLKVKQKLNFEGLADSTDNCAAQNSCVVIITATDPSGATNPDSGVIEETGQPVTITIENVNEAPMFDSDSDMAGNQDPPTVLRVAENQEAVILVGSSGITALSETSYAAEDEDTTDADTVTYMVEGADQKYFNEAATGGLALLDGGRPHAELRVEEFVLDNRRGYLRRGQPLAAQQGGRDHQRGGCGG